MDEVLENVFREVEALPEEERRRITRVIEAEVREARRRASPVEGQGARLVERMTREAPMAGKSEEFLKQVREFRDNFDMGIKRPGR